MIKEREPVLERLSVLFQVILTLICFYLSGIVVSKFTGQPDFVWSDYLPIALLMAPVWFVLLELFELGAMARIQRYRHIASKYLAVVTLGGISLFFIINIFKLKHPGNEAFILFTVSNFIVLFTQKSLGRTVLKYFRQRGYNTRLVLIIADESSENFIDQMIESNFWGYLIGGIITNANNIVEKYGTKFNIISEKEDFAKLIDDKVIDEVFFCKNNFRTRELQSYITKCREIGVIFHLHSDVLSFAGLNPKMSILNRQYFLSFRNTPENYLAFMVKRSLDYLIAIVTMIATAPVMGTISLLIKLEDGGPVFFKQTRVGKNGRHFQCLKFRTMVTNAEELKARLMAQNEQDGPVFKIKNDPRITRVGKFLRKTSLDEFPQFINVLMGDMSVVGPRPPIPEEVKQYTRNLTRRLSINPGITCTWQVSGRNNIPFEKWMEMDLAYIDNWSLKLDFIILLKTFKVILSGNGQ
jgi:exopolysaccharide biosynthesis polyprenyl glycosylphosphotransferase